jgi:nucleotide-binding universal stress UspA family protein
MKKIVIAFDGKHFSEGAFEFVKTINEMQRILLIGAFLPQTDFAGLWAYAGGGMAGSVVLPFAEDDDVEIVTKNIDRFELLCRKNNIEYRVHKQFIGLALPELIKETRFADLLLIGGESFYKYSENESLGDTLKDALRDVECPVIVVPEKFNFPEHNILAYDGSESSAYAIKQFAYLFPEFANNSTTLIYVNEKSEKEIPDKSYIEELAARHYTNLSVTKLTIDSKKYLPTWLSEEKKPLLISGSFGRKGFGSIFHKSFVSEVIKEHRIPVFIAHHK